MGAGVWSSLLSTESQASTDSGADWLSVGWCLHRRRREHRRPVAESAPDAVLGAPASNTGGRWGARARGLAVRLTILGPCVHRPEPPSSYL